MTTSFSRRIKVQGTGHGSAYIKLRKCSVYAAVFSRRVLGQRIHSGELNPDANRNAKGSDR